MIEQTASTTREQRLAQTFVELADTLVDDFDVVDFLHTLVERCVELLDVSEAGLLLADSSGALQVMAASNERAHVLELFQLQNEEGPCLDCYNDGEPVYSENIADDTGRWPSFAAAAMEAGFQSVQALPMRLRSEVFGALNLFSTGLGRVTDQDESTGQALADVATIGLVQERLLSEAEATTHQLQGALNSRVVVEQAKGVIAEQSTVDMDEAFARLRSYARNHNRRLSEVAREVITGTINARALTAD